jgi:FkbM family methyltransferase
MRAATGKYPDAVPSRLGSLPVLRTLKQRPAVVRAFGVAHRAFMVERPLRFAVNEWRRAPGPRPYRPHGAAGPVFLRHDTSDLDILDEVFGRRLYRFPPEVAAGLAAPSTPLRVLDLGGHIGLFGAWVLAELPGAELTSVEADPANAALLRRAIEAGPGAARWRLLPVVAGTRDGELPFASGAFAESHVAEGAPLREARDVLPLMAGSALVKIDIEGGEWSLLTDPRFAHLETTALVIEYHPAGCPGADPQSFVHGLLREAGYATREIADVPLGAGMLWAWRDQERVSSS